MDTDYLTELNDVQRGAVTTTTGPVLIVAGPGSGKTRVLTYRIAHLLNTGIAPWNILSLTFTNKAAKEMKERISKVAGDKGFKVWAGTFHSIFAKILRIEADKIGYPSSFTIYDTDDSKSLIKSIIKQLHLNKEHYNVNAVRARISSAKSQLITPKLYAQREDLMMEDAKARMPHMTKIYTAYTVRCKQSGAMDFDDLLYRFYELLQKSPETLAKYQERFQHILVDEFQDTNQLQYAIIRKLVVYKGSTMNICAVGDDAQSIYAFRGATIQNILDFEKEFKPHKIKVFKLEQNYRSTHHIVKIANQVIRNNSNQIQKEIWSDKGDGHKVKVINAKTDNEEGKRVADTIVEQKNRYHLSNNEIAVLYRTNAQSRIIEEYLRRFNIPYRVFGGLSFYQRKEVKDAIAYLRLTVNPNDDEALKRVLNFPKRGIGNTTMDKIEAISIELSQPLWDSLPMVQASARAKNSINNFVQMIKKGIALNITKNASEVANFVLKKSGLYDLLKNDTTIEGMNRLENFNALLDGINSFVEDGSEFAEVDSEEPTLANYLQNIALLTDFDTKETDGNFVTLMTVHAAKGLEFKSIFLVGLEENLFPSFMSMNSPEAIDEERRLFYVAITRAEQYLTLTHAQSRYQFGNMRFNNPSRFLDEIPVEHVETPPKRAVSASPTAPTSSRSGVSGNFKRRPTRPNQSLMADPASFKPDPSSAIQTGMKVLHLKFGKGKVLTIDGKIPNRVATIFFEEIANPERKIMLKFAKLQILK